MNWRRIAIFLGLNVLVSAATTLIVLSTWDAGRAASRPVPTLMPTVAGAALPAGTASSPTAPTATPAAPPTETPGQRTYVVQPGDTLSSIARSFNVAVEDLRTANNLVNTDLLSIGQPLIIPSPGSVPATAAALAVATSTATPVRPRPVSTATLTVTLISSGDAFVTIKEIINPGVLTDEAVVIANLGDRVNLAGWSIADGEGNKFTFPDLTLLANAEVKVHTTNGVNTATDLYWGQTTTRWGARGTVAYLRDPQSKLIGTYRVP